MRCSTSASQRDPPASLHASTKLTPDAWSDGCAQGTSWYGSLRQSPPLAGLRQGDMRVTLRKRTQEAIRRSCDYEVARLQHRAWEKTAWQPQRENST